MPSPGEAGPSAQGVTSGPWDARETFSGVGLYSERALNAVSVPRSGLGKLASQHCGPSLTFP